MSTATAKKEFFKLPDYKREECEPSSFLNQVSASISSRIAQIEPGLTQVATKAAAAEEEEGEKEEEEPQKKKKAAEPAPAAAVAVETDGAVMTLDEIFGPSSTAEPVKLGQKLSRFDEHGRLTTLIPRAPEDLLKNTAGPQDDQIDMTGLPEDPKLREEIIRGRKAERELMLRNKVESEMLKRDVDKQARAIQAAFDKMVVELKGVVAPGEQEVDAIGSAMLEAQANNSLTYLNGMQALLGTVSKAGEDKAKTYSRVKDFHVEYLKTHAENKMLKKLMEDKEARIKQLDEERTALLKEKTTPMYVRPEERQRVKEPAQPVAPVVKTEAKRARDDGAPATMDSTVREVMQWARLKNPNQSLEELYSVTSAVLQDYKTSTGVR